MLSLVSFCAIRSVSSDELDVLLLLKSFHSIRDGSILRIESDVR